MRLGLEHAIKGNRINFLGDLMINTVKKLIMRTTILNIVLITFLLISAAFNVFQFKKYKIKKQAIESCSSDIITEEIAKLNSSLTDIEQKQEEIKIFHQEVQALLKSFDASPLVRFASANDAHRPKNALRFAGTSAHRSINELEESVNTSYKEAVHFVARAAHVGRIFEEYPTLIPAIGRISSPFGFRADPFSSMHKFHRGVDIAAIAGSDVLAPARGTVLTAKYDKSYGNLVEIMLASGLKARFAHLRSIHVKAGQKVESGDKVGVVGSSGSRCAGTHLHYEIHDGMNVLDPKMFMLREPARKALFF